MAIVQTLEAVTRPSFRLGDSADGVSRVVLDSGGPITTPPPMLWQTGVETIDQGHLHTGAAPDVDYYIVSDAELAGGGAMPCIGGAYLFSPTLFPEYVRHFIERDIQSEFWIHPAGTTALELPIAISIIHYNLVFGHWLLEMFPKLLLLKSCLSHLRSVPIILPSSAPEYVRKIIRAVLGDWPIVTYDRFTESVKAKILILPGSLQTAYYYHPQANRLFDEHAAWAASAFKWDLGAMRARLHPRTGAPKAGEKLFVSRRSVTSGFRKLTNAPELEIIAKSFGFKVIAPERMSWKEQVATFSQARFIVGEFGSGMHNTIFSPRGAKVVCLNWIVETQSRIANLRTQSVGYVLSPDDQPKLFSLDGRFSEFEIDPQRFKRALEQMTSARTLGQGAPQVPAA